MTAAIFSATELVLDYLALRISLTVVLLRKKPILLLERRSGLVDPLAITRFHNLPSGMKCRTAFVSNASQTNARGL